MYIYLIDHYMIGENAAKKTIKNDSGRTKVLRAILNYIKESSNSKIEFNALGQVYNTNNNLLDLTPPFILFIHTSNDRCNEFLENLFKKKNLGPSWIACYSGGKEPIWYKNLKTNGFQNIRFFEYIGETVESKWNIKAFIEAVIQNQPNPFEYLELKGTPHLIALSILCQGYLAAHGAISLLDNLGKLKGTVKSKAGITEDVNWWLPVISGNTKSARDELGDGKNKKVVEDLLNAIDGKDEKALSGGHGIKIVESAYKVLPEILQGTS